MTTPRRPHEADAPPEPSIDAEPSPEEARAASELREALANPALPNDDAALLRALSLAQTPRPLAAGDHQAFLERALRKARPERRGQVIRVAFGAITATLAIAASVVFLVQPSATSLPAPTAALARVRSTQPLFDGPFAHQGGESSRVDRIALARASDFRDNQFTRWGVR
jgi:hypothetical protein